MSPPATRAAKPKLVSLVHEATTRDDVSLMGKAISAAAQPGSRHTGEAVIQLGLRGSIGKGALSVLRYLLGRGGDITAFSANQFFVIPEIPEPKPSRELLGIMVEHGWDINTLGSHGDQRPLLWRVVEYPELVACCLGLGARVDIPYRDPRYSKALPGPYLLDVAAERASIETFELLRGRGAPLSPRTLHAAVRAAALLAPIRPVEELGKPWSHPRLDMVRHLIDVVKLDVNAVVPQPATRCTTPLCWAAKYRRSRMVDVSEIVRVLLDAGADPELSGGVFDGVEFPSPMECAREWGNESFLQTVEEWRKKKRTESDEK